MAPGHDIAPAILSRWGIETVAPLAGGFHHLHWHVRSSSSADLVVRRYREDVMDDLAYEFEVMRRLADAGVPAPRLVEPPVEHGGTTWCLMEKKPGGPTSLSPPEEERRRGRLLAEFHRESAGLVDLGQRSRWQMPDERVHDAGLHAAVARYEALFPQTGAVLRWHLDRAAEHLAHVETASLPRLVLHGDFVARNLLFEGERLTGIVDFETTHLSWRVSEFALAWRGCYDEVVHGYEEVSPLSGLERSLLAPVFWSWLFIEMRRAIDACDDEALEALDFSWPLKMMGRRSPLFGDLLEPCPHGGD